MFKQWIILTGLLLVLAVASGCALTINDQGLFFAAGNATAFDKENKAAEGGEASMGFLGFAGNLVSTAVRMVPFSQPEPAEAPQFTFAPNITLDTTGPTEAETDL